MEAMMTEGMTNMWMGQQKAFIAHPEMNSYNKVQLRVRAVLGFHEFPSLHKCISEELGRRGLMHKPFPVPSTRLLDPNILTSDGVQPPLRRRMC